jgi:hypothetical protein
MITQPDDIDIRAGLGAAQLFGTALAADDCGCDPWDVECTFACSGSGGGSGGSGGSAACDCKNPDPWDVSCMFECSSSGTEPSCDCTKVSTSAQCAGFCAMRGDPGGSDGGGGGGSGSGSGGSSFWDWMKGAGDTAFKALPLICRAMGTGCPLYYPGTQIPVVAPAWYTTTGGMVGIGVVVLGIAYFALRPTPAAA